MRYQAAPHPGAAWKVYARQKGKATAGLEFASGMYRLLHGVVWMTLRQVKFYILHDVAPSPAA